MRAIWKGPGQEASTRSVLAGLVGLSSWLLASLPLQAAVPELVVREEALRTIDTVELFRNGLYWWTSSACSGDVIHLGGAAYIAYSDPRLTSSAANHYNSIRGSSGGFKPGDIYELGVSISDRISGLKGVLLPDCGYGASFVRDDEAFYYAKNRGLYRKPLTAFASAPGSPINFAVGIRLVPVPADGVLFATDAELWSYSADLQNNRLTVNRTRKRGTTPVSEVVTIPGVSLRKFALADIQDRNGVYGGSELIMLTPDGRLYRAGVAGGNPQLIRTGVSDFAFRDETYQAPGNLGLTVKRHATTLYIALGNPLTLLGDGQLLGLDLTPGARGEFVEYRAGVGFRVTSIAVDKYRIFLTRTPASGQANSDLLSRSAPAEPTLLNLGDPDYGTIGLTREFRSLRSSGRLVYFAHGNTVQRIAANAPRIEVDFETLGLEATQGIQNLNHTVPLVAGKSVVVRGYARVAQNSTRLSEFDVPAQLRVRQATSILGVPWVTELPGSPLLPVETPAVTAVASLANLRTNLAATFQFEVPAEWVKDGELLFDFVLNPGRIVPETGDTPLANNTSSARLTVRNIAAPTLVFAPMLFGGGAYDPRAPGSGFWDIIARARTLLPVPGLRVSIRNAPVFKPVVTLAGIKARSFDLPENASAALLWLSVSRTFDDNPLNSHYVGMFPAGVSGFNGKAYNPGHSLLVRMGTESVSGAPWNSIYGGRTLAHELSHNFGFRHIKSDMTCGSTIPDGPYDTLPNGASPCTMGATDLDDPATSVGFDPLSRTVVSPNANGDLMSYTTQRWPSEYNWTRMLDLFARSYSAALPAARAASSALARHAAGSGPLLIVHGLVQSNAQSGELFPAYTVPGGMLSASTVAELTALPDDLPPELSPRLQLTDTTGVLLVDQPAPLEALADGEDGAALIRRALPMKDGARFLRLVSAGTVLAEIEISPSAPQLKLDVPVLAEGNLNISWTATDADDDGLYGNIQFSPDDGRSWQTLSANCPETHYSLPADLLPGSKQARIRVLATDGVHTAIATSEPFVLPEHAPEVRIGGISDGQLLDYGAVAAAAGFGYDAEDGSLDDAALHWALTGPEARGGTGGSFPLSNLSPGLYGLTLTGTDAAGQMGTHAIQFLVQPLAIADGAEPILDGWCADPGYGKTPPTRLPLAAGFYANVRFTHANGALFACFTGLPYASSGAPGTVAGLRVDTSGSGQGLAVAAGFAVNEHGALLRVAHDGTEFVALLDPPAGFSAVIVRDQHSWSAEVRIADALLGGWKDRLGLVVIADDGDAVTPPITWPPHANIDQPSSWASTHAGPLPPRDLLVNGSFENTSGTFARDGYGLMSLPAGSDTLPGWVTTSAELAWVDNANTFGAGTPFGTHSLDLTGYHDHRPYAGVSQTIPTVPGKNYRLSLSLGSNADFPGAGGQKAVSICAGSSGTNITFSPSNATGNEWQRFSFPFTADSLSTAITITGWASGGGNYLGLDQVSVEEDYSLRAETVVDLVINGGFEMTCTFVPDGNGLMSLLPGSTAIPGWTTTDAELAWGLNGNAFGPSTRFGSAFLDLTGYHDRPPYGGITQVLATIPQERYRLSFSVGSDEDRAAYRGPMSLEVTAGTTSQSFDFLPTGAGSQWSTFALEFVADSPSTPLTLKGTTSAGGAYLGLDKISVVVAKEAEVLRITAIEEVGGDLRLSFTSVAGREYVLQRSADVESSAWDLVPGTERSGTGAIIEVDLPGAWSEARQFYRVQMRP
jgi:hypothetical protein